MEERGTIGSGISNGETSKKNLARWLQGRIHCAVAPDVERELEGKQEYRGGFAPRLGSGSPEWLENASERHYRLPGFLFSTGKVGNFCGRLLLACMHALRPCA